ncbi:hypothetical protein EMPS_05227 [Entomortierella parvispora]|uniref:F-box domain-containing protein n=1 Tax=Entomortierella parvispora TaxID=205924 RepID=A0A9P3H9Y0_9FUNG|nr:hypothetical protein EMPS_05227 [Entomortierella parvispora]
MAPLHRDVVFSIPELIAEILDYLGPRSLCSLRLISRSFYQACIPHFRIALQYSGPLSWTAAITPTETDQSKQHGIFQLFPVKASGHLVKSLALSNCHPRTPQEEMVLKEWFSSLGGLESFFLQESSRGLDPDTAKTVLPWIQQCPSLKHLRLRLSEITRDEVLQALLLGLGSLTAISPRLESLSVEIRRGRRGPGVNLRWEVLMETLANLPRLSSLSLHGFTVLRPEKDMDVENHDHGDPAGGAQAAADGEDENDAEEELELYCNFPKITQFQAFNCSLPKFNLARLFPNVKSLGVFSLDDRFQTGPLSSDAIFNNDENSGQGSNGGTSMDPSSASRPLSLNRLSLGALTASNMHAVLDALSPGHGRMRPSLGSSGLYVDVRTALKKTIKPIALSIQIMNWIEFEPFSAALQSRGIEVREFTFTKGLSAQASMLSKPCFKNLQVLDVTDLGLQFGNWLLELQPPTTIDAPRGGEYDAMHSNALRDGEEAMLASVDRTFINSKIPFAQTLRSLHLGAGDFGNGRFAERERNHYRFVVQGRAQDYSQRSITMVLRRILACLPALEEFSLGTALECLSLFEGLGRCDPIERRGFWSEWQDFAVAKADVKSLEVKGGEETSENWLKYERPFLRSLRIYASADTAKKHKANITAWQKSLEYRFRFLETLQITLD